MLHKTLDGEKISLCTATKFVMHIYWSQGKVLNIKWPFVTLPISQTINQQKLHCWKGIDCTDLKFSNLWKWITLCNTNFVPELFLNNVVKSIENGHYTLQTLLLCLGEWNL